MVSELSNSLGYIPSIPLFEAPTTGLGAQRLDTLCVRMCNLEACKAHTTELTNIIKTAYEKYCAVYPFVANNASASSSSDVKQRVLQRWNNWKVYLSSPPTLSPLPAVLFPSAAKLIDSHIGTLAEAIGVYVVFVELRWDWLPKLYLPSPSQSNRITKGEMEDKVNGIMPVLYKSLGAALFPQVTLAVFKELMHAIYYIMLYGRRSIQQDQVKSIIEPDIATLLTLFSNDLSDEQLDGATKQVQQICEIMHIDTDKLIQMYNSGSAPVSLPIMARIIACRSGKNAQKLIDKIRGK